MKQAFIIIRPDKYQETKNKLVENGIIASTTINVLGRGKTTTNLYVDDNSQCPSAYKDILVYKKMMQIVIKDNQEDLLIKSVLEVNSTNNAGDGKIFITPISKCIRIHTNETDDNALS